ncbi:MAG TPA: AAA family ATPase [Gaiellaceae bacterium]|nr:AAA family ATPase [Gaiellaceae bacterium]
MPSCPVCTTENPEVARFCLGCGAALSAEPRREERKVVTVLFADLVGFTSRAEQLDPEDVRAVLAPYWERLRTELERRGGTVEKFIGDAVMALFGAPVAHEDDPLRAVGAALAIRDWARDEADVQVRIAVTTGEALVLLGARPAEGEGMAAGDVVNTAARLQSAAPVNGVLVGESTYRATRDVIDYAEHEPVVAKGKSEPIRVWEAVQVRARLGMDVERATLPLVGRTRELGVIVDAFERARSEREPQLVTLVGVPGIGKSRLVSEFFARLESDPELVWWRQGRALPYGEGVSFWALAEMVKAQAGIDENDDAETAAAKLRDSVDAVVDEDERAWVIDHLLPLVGVEAGAAGGESAPAWRRYVEGLAEQRPLVMVFEDMHWADEGLLDFVDHLVDWATGVPLLVIATARPELLDRRSAWGGGKLNTATIALAPMSDEESAQVIHGVLEQAALPAETQQALVERAGGNPLYAEQFARLYLERGTADDLPLPETVQGLIAARLDGLSAEEKRLLQDAAVIGKVFWAGAVSATDVERWLHALERKGMVRRERRSSVAGETQYAFRHVLVRDVAYGQIPRPVRAAKHAAAAEWIEGFARSEDQAELVAHHLKAAFDLGVGDAARVAAAFSRAGERAQALGASAAAERYFEQALDLVPVSAPERPTILAAYARSQFSASGDPSQIEPALAALEAAGRHEEAAEFAAYAANALWMAGTGDPLDLLHRAGRLLDGAPPSPALAAVLAERARIAWFQGDHAAAFADLEAALPLASRFGAAELEAGLLATQAVMRMTDGDLDEARELNERTVAIAPTGTPPVLRALGNAAVVEFTAGNVDAARRCTEVAKEAARRVGDRPMLRWLDGHAADQYVCLGRWDEALSVVDAGFAGSSVYSSHYQGDSTLLLKGMILVARGDVAAALAIRDGALTRLREGADLQMNIPIRARSAWISLVAGDEPAAAALADELLDAVERGPHRAPAIDAATAVVFARVGRGDRWSQIARRFVVTKRSRAARLLLAGSVVESAEVWATVSPFDEAVARLYAAHELAGAGRGREAALQLQRALAFFRAVGAAKIVGDANALLAAAS